MNTQSPLPILPLPAQVSPTPAPPTPALPAQALSAEDRTAEILWRIRGAFVEKGFDGASMQDLARAAGMSVGNFYRYFPSKAAIIEAMVSLDMAEMQRDFATIRTSGDPMAALRSKVRQHLVEKCAGDGQLWAEITAAALRKPEIAAASCRMEVQVAENLLEIFAQGAGLALPEARTRFDAHARFLVLMVKAAAMRPPEQQDQALTDLIYRTIDTVLTDISRVSSES